MNNDYSDQILESMLEESLGGKTPPDLSDRILAAWQREKVTGQQQDTSPVLATQPASVRSKPQPIVAEVVRPAPIVESTSEPASVARSGFSWRPLLATSAVIALLLTGWALRDQFGAAGQSQQASSNAETLAQDPADGSIAESSEVVSVDLGPSLAASATDGNAAPINDSKAAVAVPSGSQALPLDDLPFGTADKPMMADQMAARSEAVEAMSDERVVQSINGTLAAMWMQSGVQPTESLPQSQWIVKASERLLGTKKVDLATVSASRRQVVEQFVGSQAFATTWSKKLASAWLEQSPGSADKIAADEIQTAIEKRLRDGRDFNEVAVDLLGGDLGREGPTQAFVGSLAGGGNHNLLRRIGTHFLGANLGCVQCHDRGAAGSREIGSDALAGQEAYWSLIAMLRGVDVRVDEDGHRSAVDNQSEVFGRKRQHNEFFELPDGRMKAAVARLPDGREWTPEGDTPRQALAKWIAQSQEFDLAIANQVWEMVTGEAIVYDASYPDLAALESRQQLLKMLSQQFRSNGRSVQKLATWIVSSEAFDRSPIVLSADQLLVASPTELEQAKLMRRLFAASNSATQSLPLERNMVLAASFRKPSTADEITLAQSSATVAAPKKRPEPTAVKAPSADQLDFTLSADHVSFANAQYVDTLLQSKRLTWEQRVGHVVLLDSHARVSDRVKQLANTLLQHHNGDSRAALLDLLWAVRRSL